MGKIFETTINRFGSMTQNYRLSKPSDFALSAHFDIYRNGTLAPNRTYLSITDASEKITRFIYGRSTSSSYYVYGLGDDGSGLPKVFYQDPGASAWTALVAMSGGARATNVFFIYKDILYGWQNGNKLWSVALSSTSVTDAVATLSQSYTNLAQPVHHKADDVAYFFHDNIVSKLDNTTPTTPALTLPSNVRIAGGASYGNYLAIVTSPINPGETNSTLYLWDRDSSLSTISGKVDLGFGDVIHVGEAQDGGIFITQQVKTLGSMGNYNNSIVCKYYNGTIETVEIPSGTETEYFSDIFLYGNGIQDRDTFYFPAKVVTRLAAETRHVVFAVKRTSNGLVILCDQEVSSVSVTQNINGIFNLQGHWYVSYDANAKTLVTRSSSLYPTAVYESSIFSEGTSALTKKLVGITVLTSPLPSAGSVILSYRKDEETAWTDIFTNATDNSVSHDAVNIESTGVNLPQYNEIQFRIQSTGGAEIIGFTWKSETIDNAPY